MLRALYHTPGGAVGIGEKERLRRAVPGVRPSKGMRSYKLPVNSRPVTKIPAG